MQLYHSLCECADPAVVLDEALRLVEGRDGQVSNLVNGVEELNRELEEAREQNERLEADVRERERELEEALAGGGGEGHSGSAGLSLAEREEVRKQLHCTVLL